MDLVFLRGSCPLDALIAELLVDIHLASEFVLVFINFLGSVNEIDECVHSNELFERQDTQ